MAVLLGVCNWVHPLLQSPSCCKELKEAGLDAIQLDLGSAEEDFPLSSPGIQRQWKEEAELYGIRLDAVAVLAVLKHGMTAEPGSERRNTAEKAIAALPAAALLNANEKLKELFVKGKKKGRLDAGELSEVLDEMDLDGVVNLLEAKVTEALVTSAEGVHI